MMFWSIWNYMHHMKNNINIAKWNVWNNPSESIIKSVHYQKQDNARIHVHRWRLRLVRQDNDNKLHPPAAYTFWTKKDNINSLTVWFARDAVYVITFRSRLGKAKKTQCEKKKKTIFYSCDHFACGKIFDHLRLFGWRQFYGDKT